MTSIKYQRFFWRPQILHRQIWRECWEIFAVSLVVITFIVFMGRITRVMQMIITRGGQSGGYRLLLSVAAAVSAVLHGPHGGDAGGAGHFPADVP